MLLSCISLLKLQDVQSCQKIHCSCSFPDQVHELVKKISVESMIPCNQPEISFSSQNGGIEYLFFSNINFCTQVQDFKGFEVISSLSVQLFIYTQYPLFFREMRNILSCFSKKCEQYLRRNDPYWTAQTQVTVTKFHFHWTSEKRPRLIR